MRGSKQLTIPTISFFAPHWELVFRGKLALDSAVKSPSREKKYGVKTRKDRAYSHRGLVLCYTSQKSHFGPIRGHKLAEEKIPRGIVGCARIVDVVRFAVDDKVKLFFGYNNSYDIVEALCTHPSGDAIYAMDYGYLMRPFYRFKKPVSVLGKQYMFGPVGRIPLLPEIEEQLPKWAKREVERMRS